MSKVTDTPAFTAQEIGDLLNKNRHRFIDFSSNPNPSWKDWIFSMGTNITCYEEYLSSLSEESNLNNSISTVRTIIYAIAKPLQSQFFYWTLLLLILHKFNFKKPVMKIILAHYVLRAIGDIIDQLGNLMDHYHFNEGDHCGHDASTEKHPLRWFLTRQIGNIFWYTGEICGDWYPLLRTRAVAREQRSIWFVYISCALFNLSKITMIIIHYTFSVKDLFTRDGFFNNDGNNTFYDKYWATQAIVIITSLIYDITVFAVLKRQIFSKTKSDFGFLKKFRSISEYRIIVSVVICFTLLPTVLVAIAFKFYFSIHEGKKDLNFSFEDIRLLIANVQYFMIFIDQIMLFRSRDDSSMGETTSITNVGGGPYSSNNLGSSNSNQYIKPYNIDSKLYYTNLNSLNNALSNTAQSNLMQYNYSNNANNNNNLSYGRMKSNNNYSNRNNTLANYDDYNGTANEWNYLRR